jgi:hypothetical protein
MKHLNTQIQISDPNYQGLPELLGTLVMKCANHDATSNVFVESGDDNGKYYNVTVESGDVASLWPELKEVVCGSHESDVRCIVTCQGEDEWDDYRLLYHFDESEIIDATGF